jgi:hypothetical protein
MRADAFELGVNLTVAACDPITGDVLQVEEVHNLVTLQGRNLVRDLLNEANDNGLTHIALGTDETAAAASDTNLRAEVHRDTFTKRISSDGVLTLQYFLASSAANGSTLREAGLFNAATGGVCFARATHGGIAKSSAITVTYTWQITITAI